MANQKTTKKAPKKATKKATPKKKLKMDRVEYDIVVTRAVEAKYNTLFDVTLNGVKVYGCRVCQTRDGEPFVGWPQKQGKDGNYYCYAWAYLEDDQVETVMAQIARLLDEEDDEDEEDEDL